MDRLQIQLSDASGVPYYRQIVDQMSQLIRSGQLAQGDQLPSVRELTGQLLVSLITTRRAYADLEAAGLIKRRQGHGTFVAEEIEMASHDQAMEMTLDQLEQIVGDARRMGLEDDEIQGLFAGLIHKGGRHDQQ
ncbi:MAG: GntR family transcriptional regulator [Thermoanaerobaculales bacterium]|nr:GntR family transcriptional regulator [Thermoanaerobaculales bacterium]